MPDGSASKTPATIKIASKNPGKRGSGGSADPGPGDPNAEPSMAPELVDIPQPPTASELVVKSTNSRAIKTIQDPVSLPKTHHSSKSQQPSGQEAGASRESTSSKALSSTKQGSGSKSESAGTPADLNARAVSGSGGSAGKSAGAPSRAAFEGSASGVVSSVKSKDDIAATKTATTVESPSAGADSSKASGASGTSASAAMQADSQQDGASGNPQEQDEIEEGEGEVEHPETPASQASSAGTGIQESEEPSGGVDSAPASSGGGRSKLSPKTSSRPKSSHVKSSKSGSRNGSASETGSDASSSKGGHPKKKKKKVTKFRYHKRITVRTHGKTSPSTIMSKVNKKDHKAGITPSTIEDMDTEELMRRAGIKGNKKTHWRVRLRQTKRLTKNGKTTTQTKVAYRDSEGNKRVKTSASPYCKSCGKKLEDCKCDEK